MLGAPEVSSTDSIPTGFCSQKLWELIFLALEPLAGGPGVGLWLLTPKISLPNFYPPHVGEGPDCSASAPLLPVRMDVVSLILYLSDFHLTRFLTFLSDGCSFLDVILMWLCKGVSHVCLRCQLKIWVLILLFTDCLFLGKLTKLL